MSDDCMIELLASYEYWLRDDSSKFRGVGLSYGKALRSSERLTRPVRAGATLKAHRQGYIA